MDGVLNARLQYNMVKKVTKIACLIPNNYQHMDREFVINLLGLVLSFNAWNTAHGNRFELQVFIAKEGAIDIMRERLATMALEWGAAYLLWLDSDQLFPSDFIQNMVGLLEKHRKIEAVTGLYTYATPPFLPHAYHEYNKKTDKFTVLGGFPLKQLFPVQGAGFGCLCIRASVFKKLSRPYFEYKHGVMGEDLYFFRKFIQENNRPVRMYLNPLIECLHMTKITVGIASYIQHQKIKVENNVIRPTPEQVREITKFQERLTNNFLQNKTPLDKKKKKKA